MNILIITPYAEPEKGACVVRVNGFRDYFEQQGQHVEVFAPNRNNLSGSGVIRYSGIAELMLAILFGNFGLVIGTSPPITHNFFALIASKISGKKFFLDAKDPFTEIMRKLEPEKAKSVKFLFFRFAEHFTHRFSDKVIFLNKPNLDAAGKKFSLSPEKLFLAPNGSDTKKIFYSEEQGKKLRKLLKIRDEFVLLYIGGTGDKDLIGFADKSLPFLTQKAGIRMIFILSFTGADSEEKIIRSLKSKAMDAGMDNAHFVLNVPFGELYKYASAADAGLVAYPDFEMHVIGAKVFDYIAAGLPVAAKASKNNFIQKEFLESNNIGFQKSKWDDFNFYFMDKFIKQKFDRKKIIEIARKNSREKTAQIVLREIIKTAKVKT